MKKLLSAVICFISSASWADELSKCYEKFQDHEKKAKVTLISRHMTGGEAPAVFDFSKMPQEISWKRDKVSIIGTKAPKAINLALLRENKDYGAKVLTEIKDMKSLAPPQGHALLDCVSTLVEQFKNIAAADLEKKSSRASQGNSSQKATGGH